MAGTTRCGITLIPAKKTVSCEELRKHFPNAKTIIAVDFYITGAENWKQYRGTSALWKIDENGVTFINIDHHAPTEEMMRFISSGNVAASFVRRYGTVEANEETVIVINHCDADSIVASCIIVGIIEAERRFEDAVIAADHIGGENLIADALQSIEQKRCLSLSLDTLERLRDNASLPNDTQEAWGIRCQERRDLASLLEDNPGRVHQFGTVVVIESEKRIPAEMLPALLPDAVIIIATCPIESERIQVKARLGAAAPNGATLFSLGLKDFDGNFGGRWNAGSNKRGGGTTLSPAEYGRGLAEVVTQRLG